MPSPPESMLSEVKKKDLRVQNSTLILGGGGWGRQWKGISKSTMQKGAILLKCVNTFVPHYGVLASWLFAVCLFRLINLASYLDLQ